MNQFDNMPAKSVNNIHDKFIKELLADKEVAVAFDELLSRLTNFQLADEDAITVLPNVLLRGVTKLPITYEKIA